MKKNLLLLGSILSACLYAQQGKVGINTDNPTATLDIVSKANTSATKAFKISNSSSTEMVTVRDNGQVGINQASPATDALLELNSANKSLLLTRVNNATDVANPVNGMLIYDITLKCVRAYENAAWSGCLSAGGGNNSGSGSGSLLTTDYDFKNTFKEIYYNPATEAINNIVAGISSDNKLFVWGGSMTPGGYLKNLFANLDTATYGPEGLFTPAYLPLPNNEVPLKVATRDQSNKSSLSVLTQSGKYYGIGYLFNSSTRGQWTDISIPGESIVDINDEVYVNPSSVGTRLAITQSGKAFYWGHGNSRWDHSQEVTQWTQIAFPAGVNTSTFKYTKILNKIINANSFTYFLKGNDGNVYAIGENYPGWQDYSITKTATLLGTGATSTSNDILVKTGIPQKVLFPAGVDIVKIELSFTNVNAFALALAADGTAYGWGLWKEVRTGTPANYYHFAIEDANTTDFVTNPYSSTTGYNLIRPHKLKLPTGSSIFKDITGTNTYSAFVTTDKGVYFMNTSVNGNKVTLNPLNVSTEYNALYNQTFPSNGTYGANEYVNRSDILSLFGKISYASNSRVFALSSAGKAYSWGVTNATSTQYSSQVMGLGYVDAQTIPWPLPLRTGTLDMYNPNPQY